MDLSRRLAAGFRWEKTCARFETLASRDVGVSRRRSKAPMEAAGRRPPFDPPPLPELALFGLRAQPVRELAASQSKENQGKRLGFPWIPLAELGLFNGLQRIQIKKSAANSTRLRGCARTSVLNAIPPSLAPSDPLIVNWPPQKDIVYFSVFVNELDGGLKVGDPAQNEPRGQRRQISSGPWWSWGWRVLLRSNQDEPRGCPPSDPVAAKRVARRTVRPGSRAGGSTFAESLRREVVVLTKSLLKRVRRLTRR